jgi:beta-lactam-binding protein with PASTA domain
MSPAARAQFLLKMTTAEPFSQESTLASKKKSPVIEQMPAPGQPVAEMSIVQPPTQMQSVTQQEPSMPSVNSEQGSKMPSVQQESKMQGVQQESKLPAVQELQERSQGKQETPGGQLDFCLSDT